MRNFTIFIAAATMAFMAGCSGSHERTVANLKAAIDGEMSSSARYAAFADQAAKEGYYGVAALFNTASKAEAIHLTNHQEALADLGVTDYVAAKPVFEVDSTIVNLHNSAEGEMYEDDTMYKEFIAVAKEEKVEKAITSFTFAQEAERGHAQLYSDAERMVASGEVVPEVYFVCPVCGRIYVESSPDVCDVCGGQKSEFILVQAEVPAAVAAM